MLMRHELCVCAVLSSFTHSLGEQRCHNDAQATGFRTAFRAGGPTPQCTTNAEWPLPDFDKFCHREVDRNAPGISRPVVARLCIHVEGPGIFSVVGEKWL